MPLFRPDRLGKVASRFFRTFVFSRWSVLVLGFGVLCRKVGCGAEARMGSPILVGAFAPPRPVDYLGLCGRFAAFPVKFLKAAHVEVASGTPLCA